MQFRTLFNAVWKIVFKQTRVLFAIYIVFTSRRLVAFVRVIHDYKNHVRNLHHKNDFKFIYDKQNVVELRI